MLQVAQLTQKYEGMKKSLASSDTNKGLTALEMKLRTCVRRRGDAGTPKPRCRAAALPHCRHPLHSTSRRRLFGGSVCVARSRRSGGGGGDAASASDHQRGQRRGAAAAAPRTRRYAQNIFALQEYVETKGRETDFESIKEGCNAIVDKLNQEAKERALTGPAIGTQMRM